MFNESYNLFALRNVHVTFCRSIGFLTTFNCICYSCVFHVCLLHKSTAPPSSALLNYYIHFTLILIFLAIPLIIALSTLNPQISDVGSDDDQTDQDFSLNSSKLINVLGRKSTFRVHRPTPIVNVAAVFGENGANNFNHQKVKCKSNENIIQCDDMEDFRTKVFNSNSHIRRNVQQVGDPVPNRSDSPSSNSSCSSNSSISRIPNITSRSNGKQSMKSSNLAKGNQVPDNSNFYNNNQTANGATLALINNYNNNNYNASNGKRDSNITNPISTKSTSRIPPALPKNSSSASNR